MNVYRFFFKGLRGKLILTYTLVTVLALLALETILFIAGFSIRGLTNQDRIQYLDDVVSTLYPEARKYLQPGEEDLPGLQDWLEKVYRSGYASLEPQNIFDSPAAKIVDGSTIYILGQDERVIAQFPRGEEDQTGSVYAQPGSSDTTKIIQKGLEGVTYISNLYVLTHEGYYLMAVPIYQKGRTTPVVGLILVTVDPVPSRGVVSWLFILALIALTGVLLLFALAPFGALFGFVMSHGLTRRLRNLTRIADRWGEGDFSAMPVDPSQDEIGTLSLRMRAMVERIQGLMQDQQVLAQMKERNRIAQELHDTVKQQAFATLMQVRAARNLLESDPGAAEKALLEAENLIKASQQELGLVITELRPAALDGKGVVVALKEYLQDWSANACIPFTFQAKCERDLPLEMERVLYRVAQEGLSNVARHSRASAVTLKLADMGSLVRLEISDNGVGFDSLAVPPGRYGLVSMRERLAEVNGRLEIRSNGETGTCLVAEIPYPKETRNERSF